MTPDKPPGRTGTGQTVLLALAALLLIVVWLKGCGGFPGNGHLGWFWPRPYATLGIWGLIQAGLGVWVGVDANRRGLSGVLWGLLVFFTGIVGLIVYLLVAVVVCTFTLLSLHTLPTRPDVPARAPATAWYRR